MSPELEQMVHEVHDKMKIRELVERFARASDRRDRELFVSCYHPDAVDDHGMFVGGPEGLYEWAGPSHLNYFRTHQHIVTNHVCSLEGEIAHSETYWMMAAMTEGEDKLVLFGGRYLDRMEKRDGEWKIAVRKTVMEWWGSPIDGMVTAESIAAYAATGKIAKDRTDCSYDRPLTIDPARIGIEREFEGL